MRTLGLIISFLLLVSLFPTHQFDWESYVVQSTENNLSNRDYQTDDSYDRQQAGVLYDNDELTLLTTYECENDDIIPCRMNQWGQQLRVFASRLQLRFQSIVLQIKRIIHILSVYLTTLINHISQFCSSAYLFCWQYAADCYVFAFRQIII